MSHEIRTPLTAILGFSSMLTNRDDIPEDARVHVGRISRAGQSLLSIVNDESERPLQTFQSIVPTSLFNCKDTISQISTTFECIDKCFVGHFILSQQQNSL